jgi:hypothetical protein
MNEIRTLSKIRKRKSTKIWNIINLK